MVHPVMPKLPAELVDLVIDYNHSDPETLMMCALVGKQWTTSSRYHLFFKVDISHYNARQFIDLLSSPNCTILSILRRLDVHFVPGLQRWFSEFSRRLSLIDKAVITSLRVLGSRTTTLRVEACWAISSFYPQLRDLLVGPVTFDTFADFASLVSSLNHLESLSCSATFQTPVITSQSQFTASLRRLDLTSPSINPVLEFFYPQDGVLNTLTYLSLSYPTVENFTPLSTFLETPNPTLQFLSIRMDSTSGVTLDTFADKLNLMHLSRLCELHIATTPSMPPDFAFEILSKISATNLEVLKVSALLMTGIAKVDALLAEQRFKSLKKVTIIGAEWADVRQFMPRCSLKDILQEP